MYKKGLIVLLALVLILSNFNFNSVDATGSNGDLSMWTLVWEDNFQGNELDLNKWNIDIGNGFYLDDGTFIPGWGNNELQYYREENVWVEDGKLIIEGRKETVTDEKQGTFNYTSGKIHTKGKFSQRYGRFEAKIALPAGQGYWPAFWMMPEHDVYGTWAASGEIDIMENAGSTPKKIGGAIHYGGQWPNNTFSAKDYYFPAGQDVTQYNVYAIEWEPGEIRWYVNDQLYKVANNWYSIGEGQPAKFAYPAPFDQEFYLILNLAIGGWYGGNPDDTTPFPERMIVDYVRVYELTGRPYREPVEPVFQPAELPNGAKLPVDGNYVYDPNFEKITVINKSADVAEKWDYINWNFLYLDEFGGQGQVSTEKIGSKSFAKIDIANGGTQPYSIQLIQSVTMGTGRWYKLTFDAKSSTNRNINVKIGGGEKRNWTVYSPNMDYQLTNELKTYEMIFQMQQESDVHARLEFNVGLNTNPVWIGNVVLEEIEPVDPYKEDAPKVPLKDGNHVYNGTFDLGRMDRMTYWHFKTDGAKAKASVHPDRRQLEVTIEDGGTSVEAITLIQRGMNLLPTDEYLLTFDGKADTERTIQVTLLSKDGKTNYTGNKEVSLSTKMETKSVKFEMPNVEDLEGQLVFFLGGTNSDIVLDNIKLVRTTNNNISEISLEDGFPLRNGDFSKGMENWNVHIQGQYEPSSEGTIEVVNGTLVANIVKQGWEPWHIILMQNGMKFLGNQRYILEFDAKSTVDRDIEVIIDNAVYHRYFSQVVKLTDTMKTYSFEFDIPVDEIVDLKFLLGKVGEEVGNHQVFIDNVRLEIKGEREKYFPLFNGNFSKGLEGWATHLQGRWDGPSKASFEEDNEKAKISIEHTGINPWDVMLFQEGLTLEEGKTYIVKFTAKSSLNRKIEVVVDNGAPSYHRYLSKIVELTGEEQTFTFEFTMPVKDVVGLKFLLGAVEGTVIDKEHEVFIDDVYLEVKGAREFLGWDQLEDAITDQPNEDEKDKEKENPKTGDKGLMLYFVLSIISGIVLFINRKKIINSLNN